MTDFIVKDKGTTTKCIGVIEEYFKKWKLKCKPDKQS